MRVIGIDAGTTSVSGVLLNTETGEVEKTLSRDHEAAMDSPSPEEDLQSPERILQVVLGIKAALNREATARRAPKPSRGPAVGALSLTGQVHGILYIDRDANALSPLYTWQDGRGRRAGPKEGASWTRWAAEQTGYRVPSGYGFLTHVINGSEGTVPREATAFATILSYLTMQLAGTTKPQVEHSDAHPLGLFQHRLGEFDSVALRKLGVEEAMVPEIVPSGTLIGHTSEGSAVYAAAGDNQAGFIGSVLDPRSTILMSVGTSGQLTVYLEGLDQLADAEGRPAETGWLKELELRPFPGDGHLLSGASLSSGSAYSLLAKLFREVCTRYGGRDPGPLFEEMNRVDRDLLDDERKLSVKTQFFGTRRDPSICGSISGIGKDNLSPDYLVEGFLRGIAEELTQFLSGVPEEIRNRRTQVVGIGNGVRRNPLFRRIASDLLARPLMVPSLAEEAALGAAIVAAVGAGAYESYTSPERPIRYEAQDNK